MQDVATSGHIHEKHAPQDFKWLGGTAVTSSSHCLVCESQVPTRGRETAGEVELAQLTNCAWPLDRLDFMIMTLMHLNRAFEAFALE